MKTQLLLFSFFSFFTLHAQVISVTPTFPTTSDTVEIVYFAKDGNGALAGYTGDVFVHTGLITTESVDWHDWKHVVGNWGQPDPTVLMERIGEDMYRISYQIGSFYYPEPGEQILQMVFVFRNADGSLVGKNADETDILYSINLSPIPDYMSHTYDNQQLVITTTTGQLEIFPYAGNILRITFIPDGISFNDTSYCVVLAPQSTVQYLEDFPDYLHFVYFDNDLIISKYPVRLSFELNGENMLSDELGLYSRFAGQGVRFNIQEEEMFYGAGSRAVSQNRRGYLFENYNQPHYGYSYGEQNLNISVPVIVSTEGYLLFFDSQWPGRFDMGATNPHVLDYFCEHAPAPYFYISGANTDEMVEALTLLTGRQPLPPIWALGYFQSRFGYEDEDQARGMVEQMRLEDFPMDAIILDLYWAGEISDMGNLAWDYGRWPSPVQMISDFNSMGIKTILITEPYFTEQCNNFNFLDNSHYFCFNEGGETYILEDFWTGPAALIDLTNPVAADWMWDQYQARIGEGVASWWSDLGEPETHPDDLMHLKGPAREVHNIYSLLWAQLLYENYAVEYPETRLFNLIRSGYAGMQRYSTFPWSGDIQRSWEGLQAQIPIMLGMGMCGVGYMGSDLGGFAGGEEDDELYTRWMQFGTFCPVMRAHGSGIPTEPVFYPEPYKSIVRNFIQLRYQILPYNYTLAWKNSETGRPLALPMDYFDAGNPMLADINDQYLWGEYILVAPVSEGDQTSREVLIPGGIWIDFWTDMAYEGEDVYTFPAPIDQIPLFIKAGSFIPTAPSMLNTENYTGDTLTIWYYPDARADISTGEVYLDDGTTKDANLINQYDLVLLGGDMTETGISVTIFKAGEGYPGAPETRELYFDIKRIGKTPDEVLVNGEAVPIVSSEEEYHNTPVAAYHDALLRIMRVHFPWDGSDTELTINGEGLSMDEKNPGTLAFRLLEPVPNPFRDETLIRFDVRQPGDYTLEIRNMTGQVVMKRMIDVVHKGIQEFIWDGRAGSGGIVTPGIYFVCVRDGEGYRLTVKLVRVR